MMDGAKKTPAFILSALLLAGCFTEVGNPDDPAVQVTMSFSIDYQSKPTAKSGAAIAKQAASANGGIAISHFYLDVYDAEYWKDSTKLYLQTKDGEDWNDQNGNFVDITAKDTTAKLPVLYATQSKWDLFYFSAQVAKPGKFKTDTLDYAAFEGRQWMKGTLARGSGDLDFLFEIPQITRLYLVLRDSTLARKRTDEGYNLDVAFRARYFCAGIPWDSVATVKDRKGKNFAFLSATSNNGAYYDRLKENFRRAFKVDSAQIDGVEPVP